MQLFFEILAAFVIVTFLIKSTILTTYGKIILISIFLVLILSAILYENLFYHDEKSNRRLINAFMQGKTIICNQHKYVNQKNFIYESGTQSFMAKESNKTLSGIIFSINDCSKDE